MADTWAVWPADAGVGVDSEVGAVAVAVVVAGDHAVELWLLLKSASSAAVRWARGVVECRDRLPDR